MLKKSDWQATWIGMDNVLSKDSGPAPYFRKSFHLSRQPDRARLYASALGLFDISINGRQVHPLQTMIPGWTDFRHRVQTLTFDVTAWLQEGENVLGFVLGDGWYAGHLGPDRKRQIYGGAPALLAQLEIFHGADKTMVVSDKSWAVRTGPILSSDLYNGETYDARLELENWNLPGAGKAGWKRVQLRKVPASLILDPKVMPAVEKIEEIKTQSISEPQPGVFIFDLGQNIAGFARLRWEGRRGQTVQMRFGEMLNSDGTLYTENLRTARATDTYVFGRDGEVEWEPKFSFHGFRYVEVSGLGKRPQKKVITGIVLHNAFQRIGDFECSDGRVNQLFRNIRWGLRGNFLEVPTDCPQRDERLGWSGDIQVFAKTACFLYDVQDFLLKWMRDLRDGQDKAGAFPDIAPTFLAGFGNAAWADAGVIVPWVVYRRFGNTQILEENYEAMCRWMVFQERTARDFIRPATGYGDWLAIDAVQPWHAPVPQDLVGTAYFARTAGLMAQIAGVLGRRKDAAGFRNLRRQVIAAFQRQYVTRAGRVVGDCQTAYLLALAFDLLPGKMRKLAVGHLVELIRKRDWHLTTGFVGTPLLGPVLSRFGRHDAAMKLLLQDTYPSWLYTVRNGATTMWERWNSYTLEDGFGDVSMNSFNHYAYGAVGEWLVHWVAGLAPGKKAPAYRHIEFRPQFAEGLTSASARLDTPYGPTSISWKTNKGKMEGELVVPSEAAAEFQPGLVHWRVRDALGRLAASDKDGKPELKSGSYTFEGKVIPRIS